MLSPRVKTLSAILIDIKNASASGIYSLGSIIQDVWGTKVQKVRRGRRNNQENIYLNLQRRQIANISTEPGSATCSSLLDEVSDLKVPKDWKMVENNPNTSSIVRLEKLGEIQCQSVNRGCRDQVSRFN